jgi:hypothetical protein
MDLVPGRTLEVTKTQGFGNEAINIGIELCRALAACTRLACCTATSRRTTSSAGTAANRPGGFRRRPTALDQAPRATTSWALRCICPEVLNGQPRSAASDIYSLGVLLFHLITNDYHVYATSRAALIEAHKTGARKRLRDLRPSVSDGFIQVVERATATDPRVRFASAGAFETALVHLMTPPPPAPIPSGPNWRVWAAGIGAAAILTIGAVALWSTVRTGPAAETRPVQSAAAVGADVVLPSDTFDIDAAFHRVLGSGGVERLGSNGRLSLNDEVYLSVKASTPTYLYVVNEDEKGGAYLLFPLPGDTSNPWHAPRCACPRVNRNADTVGGKGIVAQGSSRPLKRFQKIALRLGNGRASTRYARDVRSVGRLALADPPQAPRDMFRARRLETARGCR